MSRVHYCGKIWHIKKYEDIVYSIKKFIVNKINLENSDWVCIINPETKMDTGELFMTFKLLKRRYRSIDEDEKIRRLDYFNHPFEVNSELRLIDDVDLPKPLSLESLATQFEPVETHRGGENVVEREDKSKKKKKKSELDFEDSTFNPTVGINY